MKRLMLALVFLASLAVTPANAVVPSTMSHQGILTDNAGNAIPDGFYNLTFRIFFSSVGGLPVWSEIHAGESVSNGQYSVDLGSITPLTLSFSTPLWLEVQVGANAPITPRVELTSSPYALSLRLPFVQTTSSSSALLNLSNPGSGPEIQIGTTANSGTFHQFVTGAANPSFEIAAHGGGFGSRIEMFDEQGVNSTVSMEPDVSGTGGWFRVSGEPTTPGNFTTGFLVHGNATIFAEPYIEIGGQTQDAIFHMGATGDISVVLPTDAINMSERLDELGVAQEKVDGDFQITNTSNMEDVVVLTVTTPASGYITLVAAAQYRQTSTTLANYASIQIDETAGGTTDSNHYFNVGYNTTSPSGVHWMPVQVQRTYFKSAGSHTFRLEAWKRTGSGSAFLWNATLTATFVPTAYGTVQEAVSPLDAALMSSARRVGVGSNDDGGGYGEAFSTDLSELEKRAAQLRADALRAKQELIHARTANVPAGSE